MSARYDVEAVRRDFPILTRQVGAYPLTYLDSGNTSQKPQQVVDYEDFTGQTRAVADVEVRARVTGYLDKICFKDGADVDVFSLQVPADAVTVDPARRGMVSFYTLPAGTSGDGSTAGFGKMYLTTQADPATRD